MIHHRKRKCFSIARVRPLSPKVEITVGDSYDDSRVREQHSRLLTSYLVPPKALHKELRVQVSTDSDPIAELFGSGAITAACREQAAVRRCCCWVCSERFRHFKDANCDSEICPAAKRSKIRPKRSASEDRELTRIRVETDFSQTSARGRPSLAAFHAASARTLGD